MALSSTLGVPHKGWEWLEAIDLHNDEQRTFGEYENCEFCGHEQIRFVHLISHRDYPRRLRVGCVCATALTEDYVNPEKRERDLRNVAARRAKFPGRKWTRTKWGGETLVLNKYRVTVAQEPSGTYRIWINSKRGKYTYPDATAAKLRAFDAVQEMRRRVKQ